MLRQTTRDDGIVTYVPGPANATCGNGVQGPHAGGYRRRLHQPNTPFKGTVTEDVLRNGKVIVPVGSELHGRVVYASQKSDERGFCAPPPCR